MTLKTESRGFPMESDSYVRKSTYNAMVELLDQQSSGVVPTTMTDLYIDPVNGNDTSADGTVTRPFKTWGALRDSGRLPKIITQDTNVWIKPGVLREGITLDGYLLMQDLSFKALIPADEKASFPYPFNLFLGDYLRDPVGVTGPTNFTATGGTKTRVTKTGAGWVAGGLRGKYWVCVDGTNFFSFGRILDNGVDWIDVSGIYSTAFDATSVIFLAEEAVTFQPADTSSQKPLMLLVNSGAGVLSFKGIIFQLGVYTYAYYAAYFLGNQCPISLDTCSLRGNTVPTFAGASNQFCAYIYSNPGSVQFSYVDFYIPAVKAGTTTGAMWASGVVGKIAIYGSAIVDNFQVWDGCPYFIVSSSSQKFRTGMLQYNYFRIQSYFALYSSNLDFNNVTQGFRLDGACHLDIRNSQMINAIGYAMKSYDHHGNLIDGLIEYTEINNCTINGIDIGGNSYLTFRNVTTDPTKKCGQWGLKIRSGTQAAYLGAANTLQGNLGAVNLGDNVTPVAWGVPTTNATHLTRIAAMGG